MIRPYKNSDKDALIKILQLNTPKYFHPTEESDFVEYLDIHKEDYFVFEEEGKIIGCGGINYFPEDRAARISWDVVHPGYQGKGIGKKLAQHRRDRIKKNTDIDELIVRTTQLVFPFY